jgi:N-glycosidase YbiA
MFGVINEFRGDHEFLSNMFVAPFQWRGSEFTSAEQAFAYAKAIHARNAVEGAKYAIKIIESASPTAAKKLGRQMPINVDSWDAQKVWYMREIIHSKFKDHSSDFDLVGALINTGARMLVEGNDWGDTFWGRSKNEHGRWVGFNTLGVILMEERGWWSRGDKGKP